MITDYAAISYFAINGVLVSVSIYCDMVNLVFLLSDGEVFPGGVGLVFEVSIRNNPVIRAKEI